MNYTYDSQNHLIKMVNGSSVITLVYDAFGNRVSKTVNGLTTQYLVEDDLNPTGYPQVVEELTGPIGAAAVTRTYTYGLQRISQNLSPSVTGSSAWTPSFYVYDGGGSVRQLTGYNATPTDTYAYDAYGNSFAEQGATPNNYLYRGEQFDADLGLYYLRARYYNPNTGRFLSRDPLAGNIAIPATLHKYLYVGANPVNRIDPRGLGTLEYIQFTVRAMEATVTFANTVDCGISIGLLAADSILGEAWGNGYIQNITSGGNLATSAIKCVLLTESPKLFRVNLKFGDYLGLASCATGFAQDVIDLNKYIDDPTEGNGALFQSDWAGSMWSCAAPLIGVALML